MSFGSELASISRRRQDVVAITLDICNLTWGVAPCTASTGSKCYNTYITCDDKPHYDRRGKKYFFTNAGANNFKIPDALPYITEISDLPTDIKENGTVTKRLKVRFADEPELTDTVMDKYYADRATIQGSFWQKLVARNPNYKGRIIELYEGFDSLVFTDFTLRFVGKIENITLGNGWCEIEAIDLLRSLDDIEFPNPMNIKLAEKMYRMFNNVTSQAEMLALPATQYDFCRRTDFITMTLNLTVQNDANGVLDVGTYICEVVAYNAANRPIGFGVSFAYPSGMENTIDFSYAAVSGASYYRLFANGPETSYSGKYIQTTATSYRVGTTADTLTTGVAPGAADRYFELTGTDPTNIADWTERHTSYDIDVDDASGMDSSGYFQLEDEIIYYGSKSSNTLQGLARGMLSTNSEAAHESGTQLYAIASPATGNPFQMLQDLLALGGIASGYISSAFTTLESAWTGIDFSFLPYSKKKKLSEIYFNAVRSVDCISWVGEDGKIEIKELTNTTSAGDLNDTENIISGSISRDLNEESRYTRWILNWNRFDGTKDLDDLESYSNTTVLVDADAESANYYNDQVQDEFFSAFIADTGNTAGDAATYVDDLLTAWKTRTKQAQEIVTLAVELKDSGYKTGDVITLTTTRLQDVDGLGYSGVKFMIIKKEPQGGRIRLTLKRIFE